MVRDHSISPVSTALSGLLEQPLKAMESSDDTNSVTEESVSLLEQIEESKIQLDKAYHSFVSFDETDSNDVEDPSAIQEILKQQIDLLGGERLYQRINTNFLELRFEAIFVKEQYKLFKWREEFFYSNFNLPTIMKGFVPYQITINFESCCTGSYSIILSDLFYKLSRCARVKFHPGPYCGPPDFYELRQQGLSFGDIAHTIVATYRAGPSSLLEASMKTALLHDLPLKDLPVVLQVKAKQGLYSPEDSVPDDLEPYGWFLFSRLKAEFGVSNT